MVNPSSFKYSGTRQVVWVHLTQLPLTFLSESPNFQAPNHQAWVACPSQRDLISSILCRLLPELDKGCARKWVTFTWVCLWHLQTDLYVGTSLKVQDVSVCRLRATSPRATGGGMFSRKTSSLRREGHMFLGALARARQFLICAANLLCSLSKISHIFSVFSPCPHSGYNYFQPHESVTYCYTKDCCEHRT